MDKFLESTVSLLVAATTLIAVATGCSSGSDPAALQDMAQEGARVHTVENPDGKLPPGLHEDGAPILRFQVDAARGRVWILTPGGVELYAIRTRQRIAQIALPGWHWAGEPFSCAPDLALGRRGEALVSSDIVPTLWKIDSATLEVTRHELALDADADKDFGFSGLAYSAGHGEIFAVSQLHGSLWRIDASLTRAQKIPLSYTLPKACGVSIRPTVSAQKSVVAFDLCMRAEGESWRVLLSPDRRSGHVSSLRCTG